MTIRLHLQTKTKMEKKFFLQVCKDVPEADEADPDSVSDGGGANNSDELSGARKQSTFWLEKESVLVAHIGTLHVIEFSVAQDRRGRKAQFFLRPRIGGAVKRSLFVVSCVFNGSSSTADILVCIGWIEFRRLWFLLSVSRPLFSQVTFQTCCRTWWNVVRSRRGLSR
jgi:hypothetical protein